MKLSLTIVIFAIVTLTKAIKSIVEVYEFERINIYTDSEYSIKSLTVWIHNWKKNGWKNSKKEDVANQDIIKKIDKYMTIFKNQIHFHHVRAHTGNQDAISKGNAIADVLAQRGSSNS